MKKGMFILVAVIAVLLLCSYVFFPRFIKVSVSSSVRCTQRELSLCLHDPEKWLGWLPDSADNRPAVLASRSFSWQKWRYELTRVLSNGAEFSITHNGRSIPSRLEALTLAPDSLAVSWEASIDAGNDPFSRIAGYFNARAVQRNMGMLLDRLHTFAENTLNVYGFNIRRTNFQNTLLLATKRSYSMAPGTSDIYALIHSLSSYSTAHGAREVDFPMCHVAAKDSSGYVAMVAVPIDKTVPETKDFFLIRMVHMEGKFVSADVKGGPGSVKKAQEQIERYMADHSLTSPAIPFEMLVTDRSKEPDTTKWVTKIYQPST